jgi:hypothetical protein
MDKILELAPTLKQQFNSLPVALQQAIYNVDVPTKIQKIIEDNKLMIDQGGKLLMETLLILLGIAPMGDFTGNLVKNVGLPSIQASIITHDINESIFKAVREELKKINEMVGTLEPEAKSPENVSNSVTQITPTKESVLAGIEQPETIKKTESSVSMSSLKSNSATPETHESIDKGIEIKINNLPEVPPKAMMPMMSSTIKSTEPFHLNIPPVANIVEAKMTSTVAAPKETIIVEEKTKLPEKPKTSGDPYRELPM